MDLIVSVNIFLVLFSLVTGSRSTQVGGLLELSFYSMGLFHEGLVPYNFQLVILHTILRFPSFMVQNLEIVLEAEYGGTYFGSLRAKLNLATLGMQK